jgi:hypothetical protein
VLEEARESYAAEIVHEVGVLPATDLYGTRAVFESDKGSRRRRGYISFRKHEARHSRRSAVVEAVVAQTAAKLATSGQGKATSFFNPAPWAPPPQVPSNGVEDIESNVERVKAWHEQWLRDNSGR